MKPEAMDYQTLLLLIAFVCATILIFILISFIQTQKSTLLLPPGPQPFPIVGNILELGKNPHKALTELSKIYGPLMTLKLGSITTIVVSSPQVAKKVLHENTQACSNRTVPHAVHILDHHTISMAWLPPSADWRNLRKLCATKIFAPRSLDATKILRQQKMQELLDYVNEKCNRDEAVDIGDAAFTTVLNTMSNTLFSLDLSHFTSNEKHQNFKNIIWSILEETGRPNVADFFPILSTLDPQRIYARTESYFKKLTKIVDEIIEERMYSRVSKTDSKVYNDVLDSLLNHVEETSSELSRRKMLHLFLDLFVAGIDTTSNTVEWAMSELLRNPDKLAKARKELCQTIGKDATLEESHISELPFLQAVVKETLRLHPPAPLLLPHKCDETVNILGFKVPENAQILVNAWAMGRDPTIWENPNMFMPERFLESDINYKGQKFELIPFGTGKRICPGLPLAHRTTNFMVGALLHNFEWKLADELMPEHMNMEEHFGFTLRKAQPLRVQAISIKHG